MKYSIFKESTRGKADYGWLKPAYYFSFSNYYDPTRMGFGNLRVLNDDWIAAGAGFPTHGHSNMEIITIPLEGAVAHMDSSGGNGVITAGEVQVMSAGTGIQHSEFNASKTEILKLLQIWIVPDKNGHVPRYDQKKYTVGNNAFETLVTGFSQNEQALFIHQQAAISRGVFNKTAIQYTKHNPNSGLFIVLISGSLMFDGKPLTERDFIELYNGDLENCTTDNTADVLIVETLF